MLCSYSFRLLSVDLRLTFNLNICQFEHLQHNWYCIQPSTTLHAAAEPPRLVSPWAVPALYSDTDLQMVSYSA